MCHTNPVYFTRTVCDSRFGWNLPDSKQKSLRLTQMHRIQQQSCGKFKITNLRKKNVKNSYHAMSNPDAFTKSNKTPPQPLEKAVLWLHETLPAQQELGMEPPPVTQSAGPLLPQHWRPCWIPSIACEFFMSVRVFQSLVKPSLAAVANSSVYMKA